MPKLRTFIEIKNFQVIPAFLTIPLSFVLHSFLCKACLGCLPLRLETARYCRPRIPPEERLCLICDNSEGNIECIYHLLFSCQTYGYERLNWMQKLVLPEQFDLLSNNEKLENVLSIQSNVKPTARFILTAFDKRSK